MTGGKPLIKHQHQMGYRTPLQQGKVKVNRNKFLGYAKNEVRELIIVPGEAELLKRIFRLYLEGESITNIT